MSANNRVSYQIVGFRGEPSRLKLTSLPPLCADVNIVLYLSIRSYNKLIIVYSTVVVLGRSRIAHIGRLVLTNFLVIDVQIDVLNYAK